MKKTEQMRRGTKRDYDEYRERTKRRDQERRRVINKHQVRELKERTDEA